MSFFPGPYSLTLHVLTTLLIIEVEWGIAIFIGWFFSSLIVFYAVGLVTTAVSIIGAVSYFLARQTEHRLYIILRDVGDGSEWLRHTEDREESSDD